MWPSLKSSCRALALCALVPLLSGCENNLASMLVEDRNHSIVLIREQPYLWSNKVNQFIVATRIPKCQRRMSIHPDTTTLMPIEVYEAGDLLWALRQGGRWYLVSTEECQVQDWLEPPATPPGRAVGRFEMKGEKVVFIPVPVAPAPVETSAE
ncbi:hypothetical protein AGMMS50225_22450 [Betaproteobacteria bacterium]|nr:hypothetical protein AGMMS50225_22450 [Betaproteobacteria bacterium]